jgi:hypothetical protein
MSIGWPREKRLRVEKAFYEFLDNCVIFSKDSTTAICLGKSLYDGQLQFITETFDALERGVHKIYVLKSRQLGISTLARAVTIFMSGLHDGIKAAVVFDSDPNKLQARVEIASMIKNFPKDYQFPAVTGNHRAGITLSNNSQILFMSAGQRKAKGSGTLGASLGLSLATLSELCSYGDPGALEAFEHSLSEQNPDRIYIYESTARGPNMWKEIWEEARKDTAHCHCIFLGWMSKSSQQIPNDDPDFERYGTQPPTDKELQRMKLVKERYGRAITPNQLAWIRRKMDPGAEPDGDAPAEYEGSTARIQEQPWVEEESFQFSGTIFFPSEKLTWQMNKFVSKKFSSHMFACGVEFTDMRVYKAPNQRTIELKVWEEPQQTAVYVVSADVAHGSNEYNDRSAVQVCRCYADGMDQVAEYAWPLIGTRQFAWVILALAAWYSSDGQEVFLIIELNGPGRAVWDEIGYMRNHIMRGYQPKEVAERGLQDIFRNVKNYIAVRPDAMSGGKAWMWQMNPGAGPFGKVRVMERLRDYISSEKLHIRSLETLKEMETVTREGDTIEGAGSAKDDRVVSLGLAVRCYEDRVQKRLSAGQRTRETEAARTRMSLGDQAKLFSGHMFNEFLNGKRRARQQGLRSERQMPWRR